MVPGLRRRDFIGAAVFRAAEGLRPLVINVNAMFDQGAHSGKGLGAGERSQFAAYQEMARRDYAVSGIVFDVRITEGAYLRTQGYSEIPSKFLAANMINLFVTSELGYDIDRDRTGGCSIGPRPRVAGFAADPFYKIFLGLRRASEITLEHEYAHHFTLDTRRSPSASGNFWADLRNDYWLWRQRRGTAIPEFRVCANSPWARFAESSPAPTAFHG